MLGLDDGQVDLDVANKEQWWLKPEFIIGEMNINSAITHPVSKEAVLTFPDLWRPG